MRIGFDARWIDKKMSGIGVYSLNLLSNLLAIDSTNWYTIVINEFCNIKLLLSRLPARRTPNWELKEISSKHSRAKDQFILPNLIAQEKLYWFHSPDFMLPLHSHGCKLVSTIHDLSVFIFPNFAPKALKSRFYPAYRAAVKLMAKHADEIITDSEHSRREICKHLNVPLHKVHTIYCGVGKEFKDNISPSISKGLIEQEYGVSGKIILYVGRQDPNKNLCALIETYSQLTQPIKDEYRLVIVGSPYHRFPEPQQLTEELNLTEQVVFTGYVPQECLPHFYRAATLFVYPSLYEGFGLPPLEAMASGIPVVSSNATSLPEVVGDAALLVNPRDVSQFKRAIEKIVEDDALRTEMIEKGLERAKHFSWQGTARQTLELYERINKKRA